MTTVRLGGQSDCVLASSMVPLFRSNVPWIVRKNFPQTLPCIRFEHDVYFCFFNAKQTKCHFASDFKWVLRVAVLPDQSDLWLEKHLLRLNAVLKVAILSIVLSVNVLGVLTSSDFSMRNIPKSSSG